MRRLVFVLGITTALFLAISIYLANELRIERDRAVNARPAPVGAAPAISRAASAPPPSTPSTAPRAPAKATAGGRALTPAETRAREAEFLAEMADPVIRHDRIAEEKLRVRARSPRLAQHLGMTDEEYDQLLELLAGQNLGYLENHARCVV